MGVDSYKIRSDDAYILYSPLMYVQQTTTYKQHNLDAIHDTVHEMARDEARHGKAFAGLLERYFGNK